MKREDRKLLAIAGELFFGERSEIVAPPEHCWGNEGSEGESTSAGEARRCRRESGKKMSIL